MPTRFGDDDPTAYLWGDDTVQRLYHGDDRIWPPPIEIVGAVSASLSGVTLNTSSVLGVNIAALNPQHGDFIVLQRTCGSATPNHTFNPPAPAGAWFTQRTYNSVQTWFTQTLVGWYESSMGSVIVVPVNRASGSSVGGAQVNLVLLRNVHTSSPVASVTPMTGGPTGTGSGTANSFPSLTPAQGGCAIVWSLGAFRSAAAANDAAWSGGGAVERLDSLGPGCNSGSGTAHAFSAAVVQDAATPTGTVTCTTTNARQYRDGCALVINPRAA